MDVETDEGAVMRWKILTERLEDQRVERARLLNRQLHTGRASPPKSRKRKAAAKQEASRPIGAALKRQMEAALQPIEIALTRQTQAITAMAAAVQPIVAAHHAAAEAELDGPEHTEYHNQEEGGYRHSHRPLVRRLSEDEDLGEPPEEPETEPMSSRPQ